MDYDDPFILPWCVRLWTGPQDLPRPAKAVHAWPSTLSCIKDVHKGRGVGHAEPSISFQYAPRQAKSMTCRAKFSSECDPRQAKSPKCTARVSFKPMSRMEMLHRRSWQTLSDR